MISKSITGNKISWLLAHEAVTYHISDIWEYYGRKNLTEDDIVNYHLSKVSAPMVPTINANPSIALDDNGMVTIGMNIFKIYE